MMNAWNDSVVLWSAWMFAVSIQLALLFALLAPLTTMLRRAPASVRHFLWALVVVKCFLPPMLAMPLTIGDWGFSAMPEDIARVGALFADPIRAYHAATGATAELGVLRSENPFASIPNLLPSYLPLLWVLFGLWALGTLHRAFLVIRDQAQLATALRRGAAIADGALYELLRESGALLSMRRLPRLILSPTASGPFLCGLLRPTIVLPATLPGDLSQEELRAVLLHELVHFRRGDLPLAWLIVAAESLFWFHPAVAAAVKRLEIERERAVDEAVLNAQAITPVTYGRALLNTISAAREGVASALGFLGFRAAPPTLEERIQAILAYRTPSRRRTALAWIVAILFAVQLVPMAPHASPPPSEPKSLERTR